MKTNSIASIFATSLLAVASVMGAVPAGLRAEEDAEIPLPKVTRFTGDYTRLDLRLAGALPDGGDLNLHLGADSDGRVGQAWGHLSGQTRAQDQFDPTGLTFADGRLQGVLYVRSLIGVGDHGAVCEFQFDVRVSDRQVSGSYKGWTAPRTGDRPPDDIDFATDEQLVRAHQVRWRHGEKRAVAGKVSGAALDAESAGRGQTFAAGRDWPQFGGPNGDFSAAPLEGELVDDLNDARLVWMSEQTPAGRSQVDRYGMGNFRHFLNYGLAGGTASPMVADGRVYLNFVIPTGTTFDDVSKRITDTFKYVERGVRIMPEMWCMGGTDVVLCLDAATGRTLWRAEMPDGLYYPHWAEKGHGKGWWGPQMAIADGRAYVITSRNITYAFDAATGEMVWARPTPSSTLRTVIDGVYLPSGSHLVGYDAATGKEIWAIRERLGVGTDIRAPLRWAHDGKNYVITGNRTGTIICADPKTGKELLRVTDSGDNSASLHLAGDYLLANTAAPRQPDEPRRPYQVGAYRLSLEGAEKIWELPGEQYPYNASNRPLMVHEGMVYHRPYGLHGRKPLEGPIVRIDTGETVARQTFPMARGFVYRLNDRLILQVDCSHEKTDLHMHQLDPKGVRQLGEIWPTDHSTTSGYWPVPMSHAVADGRIVIRGTRGIFCYDLRKQE